MNSAQNKTSSQELDPITSPAIKANDLIANLARYELLDPLLKAQAESEYINNYPIGEEFKSLSTQEAGNYLVKQLNIQSQEELNTWRQAHGFFKEDDVITYAQHLHKNMQQSNDLLRQQRALFFYIRPDRVLQPAKLSRRSRPPLYYAIEAGELEFGNAAQEYSIGPESKTQIVGPVDQQPLTRKSRPDFAPQHHVNFSHHFKQSNGMQLFDLSIALTAN